MNYSKKWLEQVVQIIGKFSDLKRRGWVYRNVDDPECDASHSWACAFLAIMLAPTRPELDIQKVIMMLVLHDIHEIYSGDITPFDNLSYEEKFQMEFSAVKKIANEISIPELVDIFLEFEEQKTPEASFAKSLDRFQLGAMMHYYDSIDGRCPEKILPSDAEIIGSKISDNQIKELFNLLL